MFQNPFKHLMKGGLHFQDVLLVLMVANWLLTPYRETAADLFADWLPTFYVLFAVAFLNLIVSKIVLLVAGDKTENWWVRNQLQSAWKKAYLETIENVPEQSIWKEKLMDVWLILLVASFFIFFIGICTKLIFGSSIYVFVFYFIVFFISLAVQRFNNIKWKISR